MLAVSSIMKRRRRNIDSLIRIIYNVKNLTSLVSTNFFIVVSQSSFENHDLLYEKSSDVSHSITDSTSNFISDTEFENDIFFALSSASDSEFRFIEERRSVQSDARNEELNLHTHFNFERTFLSIQNIDNSHHFLTSSSFFVSLTSKVSRNQLIKISDDETELVQNENKMIESKMSEIDFEVEIHSFRNDESDMSDIDFEVEI